MSSHQPDRPASVNDEGFPGFTPASSAACHPVGKISDNIHVVILFFLRVIRELQTIEVGIGAREGIRLGRRCKVPAKP